MRDKVTSIEEATAAAGGGLEQRNARSDQGRYTKDA
jgi:hypothetical protein